MSLTMTERMVMLHVITIIKSEISAVAWQWCDHFSRWRNNSNVYVILMDSLCTDIRMYGYDFTDGINWDTLHPLWMIDRFQVLFISWGKWGNRWPRAMAVQSIINDGVLDPISEVRKGFYNFRKMAAREHFIITTVLPVFGIHNIQLIRSWEGRIF